MDYLVYLFVRLGICILQALSPRTIPRLASVLAWLAYHLDKRHRLVAHDNLRHAFPGQLEGAQRDRLVRAIYLHFCTLFLEIIYLPRLLHAQTWRDHLDLTYARPIVEGLLSGRPMLLVTGHFGNWEMAGYAIGLLGFRSHAIARPLDNPLLDDFLRTFRQRTGQTILAKNGDFNRMQELLAGAGVLATLADQDAGQRGMFVDFFGRPASTHKAIALLALEYNVPLVVTGAPKVREPMHYQVTVADVILPEEYANHPDAVRAVTQRFTSALESMVRQHPEQYFWLHRRWKNQPKARGARQAA
jgi:KDO2-lipid IV(A) lauroyltransferase